MSAAIDDFLREHVFEPVDSSQLFGARQLGAWARGIPELFDLPPSYDATPPSSPDPSSVDRPPTRGRLSTIYEEGDSPVPWASSPVDVEKDRSRSKHPAYRCYLITSKHRSRAFQPRRPAPTQTSANYAPRRAAPLASPQNTAPNPHGEQVVLDTDTVTCSNELPVPHSPTPSTSSSAEKQHELLSTFFTSLLETNHRKDPRTEPPLKRARLSPTPDVVQPAQTQTQSPVRTFMSRARQVLLRRRPPQVGCAADMPRGIAPVIESLGSDTSFEKDDPPGFDEASQPVEELFRLSGASAASSAVSITTRNSCKSKKNVYTPPPGRVFLR
ncbi:hypothetical protein BV25DRAFT_1552447 [Artomyces pyxidatus]|uniref:Uncharacterized protein n=1 Tax=Artomyces pyxidatus TaxID=48021 RepID=A0ACB8SJG1_9AGAM|nr:hypothetical protein BV25DRAFT_1552447 [Artomyces pyxidatus]